MTVQQKENVETYRMYGLSYTEIAKKTGISIETIKSHCKRHGINKREDIPSDKTYTFCKQCEQPFLSHSKAKHFCSGKCRSYWWNHNKTQSATLREHLFNCNYCDKAFYAPACRTRKYCSHECYINDRFGVRENKCEPEDLSQKSSHVQSPPDIEVCNRENLKQAEDEIIYRLATTVLSALVSDGLITQAEFEIIQKKALLRLDPLIASLGSG